MRGAPHLGSKGVAGRAHRELAPGVTRATGLAFDGTNNAEVLRGKRRVDHPPHNESRMSCGAKLAGAPGAQPSPQTR